MKKIMLTFTGLVLGGLVTVYAQQDTSRNKPIAPTPSPTQAPTPQPQTTTPARQQDQYRTQDRVLVPQEQVPSPLRETLQGNQYKGWENSSIYQDRTTGEYSLDLKTGTTTPKTYRFDKNGKMVEDPNKPQGPSKDDQ